MKGGVVCQHWLDGFRILIRLQRRTNTTLNHNNMNEIEQQQQQLKKTLPQNAIIQMP